jgi:hypothetical protein
MGTGEVVAMVTVLGLVVTKLVDTVRNAVDPGGMRVPKVAWNLLAFAVGIFMAVVYDINVLHELGVDTALKALGGEIVTGFIIGSAGSGWHEVLDLFSSASKDHFAPARTVLVENVPEEPKTVENVRPAAK